MLFFIYVHSRVNDMTTGIFAPLYIYIYIYIYIYRVGQKYVYSVYSTASNY